MQASPFAVQTYAVIGCAHLRFAERAAYDLTMAVLQQVKPTHIILNGDILDCTGLSKYSKDPNIVDTLQEEIGAYGRFVGHVRAAAGEEVEILQTPGNHEARLERYLQDNAPALRSLDALTLPSLLRFSERRVQWFRDEIVLAERNLVVTHGEKVRNFAGLSVKAEMEKRRFQVSVYINHTHRMGAVYATAPYSGKVVGGWEGGTLHKLETEYVRHPDWQLGMGVITVRGKEFTVEQLLYLGNCKRRWTVFRGEMIRV